MAISFVAAGAVTSNTGVTSLNLAAPAGTQSGDLLIALVTSSVALSSSGIPGNWKTVLGSATYGSSGYTGIYYIYRTGSLVPNSSVFTSTSATISGVVLAYRGCSGDVIGTANTGSSTSPTTASQTTLYDNDYITSFYYCISGSSATWTANGSTTSRVNSAATATYQGFLIADELQATAGASATRAATLSISRSWGSITLSLADDTVKTGVYWLGGTGSTNAPTNRWAKAAPISFTASCTGTALTTTGSPALAVGMVVYSSTYVSLGTITSGSGNSWVVSTGGTYASQTMTAGVIGSEPGSGVDAYFTSTSGTGTITMSSSYPFACKNFDHTGYAGTTGGGGGAGVVYVFGNMVFSASATYYTGASLYTYVYMCSTGTASITTNGANIYQWYISPTGAGIYNLADNLTATDGLISCSNGTFNTNGYTVSTGYFDLQGSSTTNLSSSSITCTNNAFGFIHRGGSATLNAGTSTITLTASQSINSGYTPTATFYNVIFSGSNSPTINGTCTFNNLQFKAPTSAGTGTLTLTSTLTVNGTLTVSGTPSTTQRTAFVSSVAGTRRTLSVAAWSGVGAFTNWKDIGLTGAVATWTAPFGAWDLGNNTGITFNTTTAYWFGGTGATTDGTHWSSTSGGPTALNAIPGPQNSVIFNGSSGGGTVTGVFYCNDFTTTAFTGTITQQNMFVYGSFAIGSSVTWTTGPAYTITFLATSGTKTITSNGKEVLTQVAFSGVGGTWQLVDNFSTYSYSVTLSGGTLNLNGQRCTTTVFSTSGSSTKNITFNGGTIYLQGSGSNTFQNLGPTGFTTTAGTGTGTITFSGVGGASGLTFTGGGATYNCTVEVNHTAALIISGSNTFSNITNSTTGARSIYFTSGTTNTFTNFSLSGTSTYGVTIGATTASAATISKASGTVTVQYCSISSSTATGGATWKAPTNLGNTNGGNNTGWNFTSTATANGLFFGSNF